MRLRFVAIAICVACGQAAEGRNAATCVSLLPAPDSAILSNAAVRAATGKRDLTDARIQRLTLDDTGAGLLAVSWEAPPGAILILTSCWNETGAISELARVDSMRALRLAATLPHLVLVAYSEGGATSFEARGVAVYAVGDSLRQVWSGVTYEGSFATNVGTVDSAVVMFDSGGITRHSWSRKVRLASAGLIPLGPATNRTERYVWAPATQRFEEIPR